LSVEITKSRIESFRRQYHRKVGRNDPCPCGSGKKYKKCCIHSYKTFQEYTPHIRGIDRKYESGKDKGSLGMLEECLSKNIRTQENPTDLIIKPLRNIRTIRQKPAHELISNQYDVTLYQKQFYLINDTYTAIRAIRLFFANHPLAKDVKIPEHLISGTVVNY